MLGKIIFFSLIVTVMLLHDIPQCKRTKRRDQLVYGILMLPLLYLAFLFLTDYPWPNLDEFIRFFLEKPARTIVGWVKVPT